MMVIPSGLKQIVSKLIQKAGIQNDLQLLPLSSGGNNRVFKVRVNDKTFLLKWYFRHIRDSRDRLGNEFRFLEFANKHNIEQVPKAIACDSQNGLGLYEFIEGRKLSHVEITKVFIEQIIDFWIALNRCRSRPEAAELPQASEACFSFQDYIHSVEFRLNRLTAVEQTEAIQRQANIFIHKELKEAWQQVLTRILEQSSFYGIDLDTPLVLRSRCISPSDFGFHNALLQKDGTLKFIDFEYAGWDDPCKLVSDFFSQPEIPVSMEYLPMFMAAMVPEFYTQNDFEHRLAIVLPLTHIKWCCILLNDFLPEGNSRRIFALHSDDQNKRQEQQLWKAQKYFHHHISSAGIKGIY